MLQRLNYIDALRGFAVLGVIAIHSSQHSSPFTNYLNTLVQQGKYGVQLFYVISAFTLFLSMSVRKSTESNALRNFFIRRLFRIAPLFWCAIIFYLLRDGFGPRFWLGDAPAISLLNIIATATFTNGWNPYWINSIVPGGWSVAVEMVFYLTVPFLYQRIKSIGKAGAFTFLTLVLSLVLSKVIGSRIILISDSQLWNNFLYFWLPNQMPIFGLGFVLFFISRRLNMILPNLQHRKEKSCLLLIVFLTLCSILAYGKYTLPVNFLYGVAFLVLTVALQIYPYRFFVNGFTMFLGKISYSAYLTHSAILPLVQRLISELSQRWEWYPTPIIHYLITFGLAVPGTLVVSYITYRLIELPGQNMGRWLISALETPIDLKVPHSPK